MSVPTGHPPTDDPRYDRRFVVIALVLVVAMAVVAVPALVWFLGSDPVTAASTPTTRSGSRPPPGATPPPRSASASPRSTLPTVGVPTARSTQAIPVTVPNVDVRPPSAVSNLRLVGTTATSVTISWDPAVDDVAVTHYVVVQDGVPLFASTVTTVRLDWPRTGGQTLVQVAAVDAAGNQGAWRSLLIVPAPVATQTSAPPSTSPPPGSGPPASSMSPAPTVTLTVTVTYQPPSDTPQPTGTPSGTAASTPAGSKPSGSVTTTVTQAPPSSP